MLIEVLLACVAHGIVSTTVHGLPAFKEAKKLMREAGINVTKASVIVHCIIWTTMYSILTPITFYRMCQDTDKWVKAYRDMIVSGWIE